jgi:hypothetical protein
VLGWVPIVLLIGLSFFLLNAWLFFVPLLLCFYFWLRSGRDFESRLDHFLCLDGRVVGGQVTPWVPSVLFLRRRGVGLLLWGVLLLAHFLLSDDSIASNRSLDFDLIPNEHFAPVTSLEEARNSMVSDLSDSDLDTAIEEVSVNVSSQDVLRSVGAESDTETSLLKSSGGRGGGSYDWLERAPFQGRK